MRQNDSKIVVRRVLVTLAPARSPEVGEQAKKQVPGLTADGQRGLTGLVGHALGIVLGMVYRIGGLVAGVAFGVTEAAGLGFLGVGVLNICMMTSGILQHQPPGRKARGDRCRGATGSEVMLGGFR